MPYYMGDYYRGDPGLLSGIGGFLGKVAGQVFKRSPIGAAVGVLGGLVPFQLPAPSRPGQGVGLPGPFRVSPTRILPGGQPFLTREGGAVPPGYHLNKSRVYGRSGAEAGTYAVRNRSMNPGNARALRRAIRREKGFVALARRVLRGTGLTISRKGMGKGKGRKRR